MNASPKIVIYLVDDDALFLKSLELEFQQNRGFSVFTFSTGEACIKNIFQNPEMVILDYQLDGLEVNAMNGIETLDKIKDFNPQIPVIMLSSQDKIEVAVNCMHHGATDYVVKSETAFVRLLSIIDRVGKSQKMEKQLGWYMERM